MAVPIALLIIITLLIVCATPSVANPLKEESNTTSEEQVQLLALLTLLEEETELATQSKMNADYVPGMVTILHGNELKRSGVATVAQALNKVAGFYISVNNAGEPVAIIRGIGASLTSNNLKIMINGSPVNRPVDASADWLMRLPINQVERIEIIRGPGSALYGEFAFSGVINIITQKDSAIGFKTGSQDHKQADVHWQHNFESGASTNLNFSHWDRNNSGRITNPDNFARSNTGHSPGQVYDHEQGTMLFSNISYQGFSSQLNYARLERGGWYGNNAALPQDLAPRIETVLNFEIEQSWELHNDFSLNANFGLLKTDLEEAAYLPIPAGTPGPGGTPPAPEDFFRQDSSEDFSNHANIALHWKGVKDHQLFMEIGYVHSEVKDSGIVIATLQGPPRIGTPDEALVLKGSDRALYSLTLQDQWAPIDSLEFTLGARYDNYDDWGDATSPRFATVWRPHDKHIFKFQFAKAFRPPTLANQYPGPNTVPGVIYNPLREETISTTEISYLYNDINHQLRVTSFYTEVENLIEFIIRPGEFPEWRNRGDLSSTGLELEWEQKLNREWNWNFNISYTHAEDSFDNDNKLTGSVAWLSNLGINWQTLPNLQQSLSIRYVGDQEAFDNRSASRPEHFPGYTIMDYSLTVDNVLNLQGLSAQVTINNISDKQYDTLPNPNQYPQGLPQGERNGWLDISYKFN